MTFDRMWLLIRLCTAPPLVDACERTPGCLSSTYRSAGGARMLCSDALAGQNARLNLGGRRRRLHPQGLDERSPAFEVLAQRVTGPADTGVRDHQGSMCPLIELVDVDELSREVRSVRMLTGALVELDQSREHRDIAVDQPLTVGRRPIGVTLLRKRFAPPQRASALKQDLSPVDPLGKGDTGRGTKFLGIDRGALPQRETVGVPLAFDHASLHAGQVQDAARPRDGHVQAAPSTRHRSPGPQRLEDEVLWYRFAIVDQQEADEARVHGASPAVAA